MVQLTDADIQTREVLTWKGLHLFHFESSSCSEKVRIFLDMKALLWESHHVDLDADENYTAWYLGINPRGLVPTLVHDGRVYIESNDIIVYLEETFPEPSLIPVDKKSEIEGFLRKEDELHLDLRTLTFGLMLVEENPPKSEAALENYEKGGSGTIGGIKDSHKQRELDYWRAAAANGFSTSQICSSALNFKTALDELEKGLKNHCFLMGDQPTVIDIAWYIYINRLMMTGYPVEEWHPRLNDWFAMLISSFEWSRQIPDYDRVPDKTDSAYASMKSRQLMFKKIVELVE